MRGSFKSRAISSCIFRGLPSAGARVAVAGGDRPECVITGGKGTIEITYKGQTYSVCCLRLPSDLPREIVRHLNCRVLRNRDRGFESLSPLLRSPDVANAFHGTATPLTKMPHRNSRQFIRNSAFDRILRSQSDARAAGKKDDFSASLVDRTDAPERPRDFCSRDVPARMSLEETSTAILLFHDFMRRWSFVFRHEFSESTHPDGARLRHNARRV